MQAFRPPEEKGHVLQVGLPTNFKQRGSLDTDNAILRRLEADIDAARLKPTMAQSSCRSSCASTNRHVPLAK
jgi:hypothetical protein